MPRISVHVKGGPEPLKTTRAELSYRLTGFGALIVTTGSGKEKKETCWAPGQWLGFSFSEGDE